MSGAARFDSAQDHQCRHVAVLLLFTHDAHASRILHLPFLGLSRRPWDLAGHIMAP